MNRENVKKILLAATVCIMLLVALNYQFGIIDAILEKVTQDFVTGVLTGLELILILII